MSMDGGTFAASLIDASRRAWASGCAWRMGETRPAMSATPGPMDANGWPGHFDGLLQHLSAALEFDAPELFVQQVVWLRVFFESHGLETALLVRSLGALGDELRERLPDAAEAPASAVVERAVQALGAPRGAESSALSGDDATTALAREYLLAALEGRRADAVKLVLDALDAGLGIEQATRDVLGRVQAQLGAMWHRSELSVVEEHLVSRTTEEVLTHIHARLPQARSNGLRVLVTSVDGDLHDIGLRVVADRFEMAGWSPIFLGASTPPAEAVMAAAEFDVQLVAAGAKLVTHLRAAAELVALLRSDPRTAAIPVIFGGRPFELAPTLWRRLGADGSAASADEALALGERLVRRAP